MTLNRSRSEDRNADPSSSARFGSTDECATIQADASVPGVSFTSTSEGSTGPVSSGAPTMTASVPATSVVPGGRRPATRYWLVPIAIRSPTAACREPATPLEMSTSSGVCGARPSEGRDTRKSIWSSGIPSSVAAMCTLGRVEMATASVFAVTGAAT